MQVSCIQKKCCTWSSGAAGRSDLKHILNYLFTGTMRTSMENLLNLEYEDRCFQEVRYKFLVASVLHRVDDLN